MPMQKPKSGESNKDFMQRCMSRYHKEENKSYKQAVAI